MSSTTDTTVFDQHESNVRGYCRRFNPVFCSASGSLMRDTSGREYIDFLSACGSLNYGHNDPDLRAALITHITCNGIAAGLDFHTTTKARFIETFHQLILRPRDMDYRLQFTGPTGTNAVEAAMKLARKVTGRTNIIAFTNGFHGVSLGALAATGNVFHRMGTCLPGISRMPYENYLGARMDTADYLDTVLADPSGGIDPPAAILLETVQGEGGLNTASTRWLRQIASIARRFGALLIVDDIQAGCGRSGSFFSFENTGIKPDMVVLSKSISGFGLPMSLVLIRPQHDQWQPAEHNGTFRGNTHAFVTATAAIEKFWSDDFLCREMTVRSAMITDHLQQICQLPFNAVVKGRAMMQGVDMRSGEIADKICRAAFDKGVIVETSGSHNEVIKILAALTTPLDALEQGLQIIVSAATRLSSKVSVSHARLLPTAKPVPDSAVASRSVPQ
jgi:diaminobutyrate-2-oxoglutarate transaminase